MLRAIGGLPEVCCTVEGLPLKVLSMLWILPEVRRSLALEVRKPYFVGFLSFDEVLVAVWS